MYSFAQRPDCLEVHDEPLYAYWLNKFPHIERPYKKELLKSMSTDGAAVLKKLSSQNENATKEKNIVFVKHIAKMVEGLDLSVTFGPNNKHFIVCRDPIDMIMSWSDKLEIHKEPCSLDTMGWTTLLKIYSDMRSHGIQPIVVDSNLLRSDPCWVLQSVCEKLQILFYQEQLKWKPGPKPYDGLWASLWYESVHKSTGYGEMNTNSLFLFGSSTAVLPKRPRSALSTEQVLLLRECLPFYDLLKSHAIGTDPLCPGSSFSARTLYNQNPNKRNSDTILDHGITMSSKRLGDPRNEHLLVWVGDHLRPRDLAKVSVFDSAVQGGDAVWEGLRVYHDQHVFKMDDHISRLFDSAKALDFQNIPTRDFIKAAISSTLAANGMRKDCHMRLTLSRGAKITSSMNPLFNVYGTLLIILPEWKPVESAATYDNLKGIKLITSAGRRNSPHCVDSKIHHCNLINNILPKIQANKAKAADALMLDPEGYVSETNATNVFMMKNGVVLTPTADFCLPGVTRGCVMGICAKLGVPCKERRISLAEFHAADEVFTTGTMGELTPVNEIDGRPIGRSEVSEDFHPGPLFQRIQAAYKKLTQEHLYEPI